MLFTSGCRRRVRRRYRHDRRPLWIARGLFTNESGLGSAAIVAAAATTKTVRQALVSAPHFLGHGGDLPDDRFSLGKHNYEVSGIIGRIERRRAHQCSLQSDTGCGPVVLTVGLFTFVYSTYLVGLITENGLWNIWREKENSSLSISVTLFVFLGSVASMPLVWDLSDTMNALMAIPNLVSLLLLSGVVVNETKNIYGEDKMLNYSKSYNRGA